MTKLRSFVAGLTLLTATSPARAERLVPAYDPRVHIRPPTMKSLADGQTSELVLDADFLAAGARWKAEHPEQTVLAAPGDVAGLGEIIIVQGNTDDLLITTGSGYGLQQDGIQALTKKVIAAFGDTFQAITLWMTFEDQTSMAAEAYEVPVKNEVEGLGNLIPMDRSGLYGSNGVLRSVLNMKTVGLRAGDTMDTWRPSLETWGQESAHRWAVFFKFVDPRTGRISDALLGRQCSHYSRYVDTQGSVHDGFAWRDNGDGSFTWTDYSKRYGNLDMYAMGLLARDEVPPFFLIDGISGYTYPPTCQSYQFSFRPPAQTIRGTRVDLSIDDVIAASGGERRVSTGERQNYWREAEVVLTSPVETLATPRVQMLVNRIEKARLYWEAWNREASRNRLVMCTKTSADCGDPRSDVGKVSFNTAGKGPRSGPLNLDIEVVNDGGQAATGVKVSIETTIGTAAPVKDTKTLGTVDPNSKRTQTFPLDLKAVSCGTEVSVKASTQSDFHFHRGGDTFLLGAQEKFSDDFESDRGWMVNPDGDDSAKGATWERGTPEASAIYSVGVQPGSAHGGGSAWVTGLSATPGARATLVVEGKATLLSPPYDSKGLRDPMLRYWVSFAGARAGNTSLEPSDQSSLTVEGRATDPSGTPGDWVQVDTLSNEIAPTWTRRAVKLPAEILKRSQVQLRFVARDANPAQGGVEAAIDDLTITSNLDACYQTGGAGGGGGNGGGAGGSDPGGKGCGCRLGGRPSTGAMGFLLLAAALLRRRRRAA